MSSLSLSPAAQQDLFDIWEHIAGDNLDAADRMMVLFQEAMVTLAGMPGMGHKHRELAQELLCVWPVKSYLIIYRPDSSPLQIVRVVSGYRDLAAMLSLP